MSVTLGMILSGNVDDDDDDDDGHNRRSGESSMMMPVLDPPKMAPQQQRPKNKYKYIVAQDPPTTQKKEHKDYDNIRPILIQRQEQRRQDRVEDFYRQHPLLQAYRRPRRQRQPTPEGEDCGNFHIHCPPDRVPRDSPPSGRLVIHDVTQLEDDHDDDDDDSYSQTSSSNSSLSSDSHKQQQQQQPALANVDLPSLPPLNAEKTVQDCQVVGKQATSMLLGRQHQYHPASRRPSSGETTKQHPDYMVDSKHFESPTSAVHFPDLLEPTKEVPAPSPPIPPRRRRPRIQRPHGAAAAAALADRLSSLSTTHPAPVVSSNMVETKDTRPRQESFTLQAELPQTKSQQERVVVLPAKSSEQNANDWWTMTAAACFSCTSSPSQTSLIIEAPPKPKQVTTTFLAPVALPAAMALTTTTSPVQEPSPLAAIAETKAKQHAPPIPERSSNNRRAIVPRPRTPARRKTKSSSSKLSKKQQKMQLPVEEEPERVERKNPKDDQPKIHGSAQDQNPMRDQEELVPNGSNISPFPHFFDLPESDEDLLAHLVPQATVLPPPPPALAKNETTDFLKLPSLSFPNNKEGGGPPYQELRIWSKTESDNDADDSSSSSPLFPIAEVVVTPHKKGGTKHQDTIRTSTSFPVPITRPPPTPQEHRKEQSMPHQRTVSFPLYLQQNEEDPIVRARQHPRQEDENEDSTIPPPLPVRSQRVPNVTTRMDQIREVLEEQQTQEELEMSNADPMVGDQTTRKLEYYLSKLSQNPVAAPDVVVLSSREHSTVQPTPTSIKALPLERQHSKDEKPPTPMPAPIEKLIPVVEKPAVKSSPSSPLGPIEKNVPSHFHSHTSTTGECFGCMSHLLVFVFCCGGGDEQESNVRPRTDTLETAVENDAPTQDDTWMAATGGANDVAWQQEDSLSPPPPQELLLPVPKQQRQVQDIQVFSVNTTHAPPLLQQDHYDDDETCVSSHFASKYDYSLASQQHTYPPSAMSRSFERRRQVHFDMQDDTESKRNMNDWYEDTEEEYNDNDLESMPSMGDATRAAYMHTVVFGPAPSNAPQTPDQQEREFVQTLFTPLPEEPLLSRIFC